MNIQIAKYKNIALLSFLAFLIPFGAVLAMAAGIMLAIEEFKNKKTALGVCLIIFNVFTAGIWSLVLVSMRLNAIMNDEQKVAQNQSNAKLCKVAFILSIIAIPLSLIVIGLWVAAIAGAFVGFALIRQNKIAHGVSIIIFNTLTFGIWSLVVANKIKKMPAQNI